MEILPSASTREQIAMILKQKKVLTNTTHLLKITNLPSGDKIYQVNYKLNTTVDFLSSFSSGIAYTNDAADTYALAEAIERFLLFSPPVETEPNLSLRKVDPKKFFIYNLVTLDPTLKSKYTFNNSTNFMWAMVYDLKTMEKVLIPSQLIYYGYPFGKTEKKLRIPISTGDACGPSFSFARLKGLLEVIERDNFTLHYLLQVPPLVINTSSDKILSQKIVDISRQLNVKALVLDFSYDFSAYTVGVLFMTTDGQFCSIGLGISFTINEAIEHALLESFKILLTLKNLKNFPSSKKSILQEIGYLWLYRKPFHLLRFLTEGSEISIEGYKDKNPAHLNLDDAFETLLQEIYKYKYDIYLRKEKDVVDNFVSVKVIVPQLLPLFISPDLPYMITPRIKKFAKDKKKYKINFKNILPAPFL